MPFCNHPGLPPHPQMETLYRCARLTLHLRACRRSVNVKSGFQLVLSRNYYFLPTTVVGQLYNHGLACNRGVPFWCSQTINVSNDVAPIARFIGPKMQLE